MERIRVLTKTKTFEQLTRYLITGFTAFGIEYGLYLILLKWVGLHYVTASVIVYALVFWFSFMLNRMWSFKSQGAIKRQVFQYGLLFLFNLVVANVVLMRLFIDVLGLSALISPFFKMACVVSWNFLIYKYIIYK